MGTKIQSKTYFPGYHSLRNLNNASNGMWTLYDEDKTLKKGQSNGSFVETLAIDRYIGYEKEKEKVKQTILKHESVFRNQLQELHRLYRRQRDLMDELGLPNETSKSSLLLSQTPEDANNARPISDFSLTGPIFGKSPASGSGITQSPFSVIKDKSKCSPLPSHERVRLEDYKSLETIGNKLQKKVFDLELPGEVYMNDEVKQPVERFWGIAGAESCPLERNYQIPSNRDVNLSRCNGLNSDRYGDASRYKLDVKKTNNLADLNEPVMVEETSFTDSVDNLGGSVDIKKWDTPVSSISGSRFWSREYSQDCFGGKDGMFTLNNKPEKDRNRNEQLLYNYKAGQRRDDHHASLGDISRDHSALFGSQSEPRKAHDTCKFSLYSHSNAAPQSKNTIFGVEIFEENRNRSVNTSITPVLNPHAQQYDNMDSKPSCNIPWRKTSSTLVQNVVPFQDNPFLHTCSSNARPPNLVVQLSVVADDKTHINNSLKSISGSRSDISRQNALCFGLQSGVKQSPAGFDLNSSVANTEIDCSGKHIKAKENNYQMNLDSSQNQSLQFFSKPERKKGPFKDLSSLLCSGESGSKRTADGDSESSRKIMGFPIVSLPNISKDLIYPRSPIKAAAHSVSGLDVDEASKGLAHNTDPHIQLEAKHSVADNALNNYFTGLRHQIDLNLTVNEEEAQTTPHVPIAVVKIATTEIDLEAPAVLESDADASVEAQHLEKKNEVCSKLSVDESGKQYDELSMVAAKAIIDISSSRLDIVDSSCQISEASVTDSLLWLADVISSCEGCSQESKVIKDLLTGEITTDEDTVPEGLDYFEFMTLKLQDSKEEEHCYKPYILENCNDVTISVTKRPRKGQARRGRQRRDFQRDILPGLVSLSRREVTEDLQNIEEMFKASGHTWQSSFSQRRGAKNGRGRRRTQGPSLSRTESAVCPPPAQHPTYMELKLEDENLTGWGKRTRRLPRQKCSTNR